MFHKIIIVLFFLVPFFGEAKMQTKFKEPKDTISLDSLIKYSKHFIGTRYLYGSVDPKRGFDCSGFVYHVFTHFKLKVPRASMDYEKAGKIIHPDSCKVGDVIVFTGTKVKNRHPGHVGIILSNPGEDIKFIHSSSSKKKSGVKISSFKDEPYYKLRFIKIVRVAEII